MPIITILFGAILDVIGVVGWLATHRQSWTALIPSILGSLLVLLGALSLAAPKARKHLMHAAAAIGLVGFLGVAKSLAKLPALFSGQPLERPAAVIAQSLTAAVCLAFVGFCVKSFIDARLAAAKNPPPQ